jgi:hypothetical protein
VAVAYLQIAKIEEIVTTFHRSGHSLLLETRNAFFQKKNFSLYLDENEFDFCPLACRGLAL